MSIGTTDIRNWQSSRARFKITKTYLRNLNSMYIRYDKKINNNINNYWTEVTHGKYTSDDWSSLDNLYGGKHLHIRYTR